MTANVGATSSTQCKCQANLGWSLVPDSSPSVCEQMTEEIGGQFELAVGLNNFANDVDQVQTNFIKALATAFNADPVNITLVYYETVATRLLQQQRRLLQSTTAPATTVESKIKVFAAAPRASAVDVSTRLLQLVPGITILDLNTGPAFVTAPVSAPPATSPPTVSNESVETSFQLYAIAGGSGAFLILICAAILCKQQCSRNDNRYKQANYDEEQYTRYPTQRPPARGGYSYDDHGYND